jgi:hypothetical protein
MHALAWRRAALKTWKRLPATCRNSASAIWLRAELPVHKKSTRFNGVFEAPMTYS